MTAASSPLLFFAYVLVHLGLIQTQFWYAHADCWYNSKRYEENSEVSTGEPCLNCTCNRSVLLCYLRVCPKLPDPPPRGCILLHRYKTCCPELICSDFHDGGNGLEARADFAGELDVPSVDRSVYANACFSNGSIYGPGSAMDSSSLCEYCYCLAGKEVCVKPKCLLPIEGCRPVFEDTSCCPVRYNCSKPPVVPTKFSDLLSKGGCLVDGIHYSEGSKVLGVSKSSCDNCYCLKGVLRCEPLICAPPLLGCTPVIKPGECCATSYNCNGTIEIEAEPKYGPPIISEQYSHTYTHIKKNPSMTPARHRHKEEGVVTVAPFYASTENLKDPIAKLVYHQRSPATYGTTRHFSGTNVQPSSTTHQPSFTTLKEENYYLISSSKQRVGVDSTTAKPKSGLQRKEGVSDDLSLENFNILSIVDSLLEGKTYKRVDITTETSTSGIVTNTEPSTLLETISTTTVMETTDYTTTSTDYSISSTTTEDQDKPTTVMTVLKSSDCIEGVEEVEKHTDITNDGGINPVDIDKTAESNTETDYITSTTDTITSVELVKFSDTNSRNKPSIEEILNITKHQTQNGDEYGDYSEFGLPPPLPNLEIIPFVAEDALDAKKVAPKDPTPTVFSPRIDEEPLIYRPNIFKPPNKTEGGFVPKEPPIYGNTISGPQLTSESTAENSVVNCVSNGEEVLHGLPVPSDSPCTTCTCFYGNIVCQKLSCDSSITGCKLYMNLCCPNYICNDSDGLAIVTVAEGIIPPDLLNTPSTTRATTDTQEEFDKILQFIFSGQPNVIEKPASISGSVTSTTGIMTPSSTTTTTTTVTLSATTLASGVALPESNKVNEKNETSNGVGLLKLAGCNIYGRMYRVGRIISELSGPCLECKCTEYGVQCNELKCAAGVTDNKD